MKSPYDDKSFFSAYSSMTRSRLGLDGAGEWETVRSLMPDAAGMSILDLGCGFGWHAKWFCQQKAAKIRAVDSSIDMLEKARQLNNDERISYEEGDIESLDFGIMQYDLVFSSLVFHYVRDYSTLIRKIQSCLKPGGCLLFSLEHPAFTAEGSEDWCYDENGCIKHFPLDNYFREGERMTGFLGFPVRKYHRTLTTYLSVLLDSGFAVTAVKEPEVPEHLKDLEEMKNEWRRPMMLVIRAEKIQTA